MELKKKKYNIKQNKIKNHIKLKLDSTIKELGLIEKANEKLVFSRFGKNLE
jgi:hypothetical protein